MKNGESNFFCKIHIIYCNYGDGMIEYHAKMRF